MSVERPLDLQALEAKYEPIPLPASEKRDDGRRIVLGQENAAVAIDIFPQPPPMVQIRSRGSEELLNVSNVTSVVPDTEGLRITNKESDCLVSEKGHIIFTRMPPPPPPKPLTTGRSVLRYGKDGIPYQQSTLDIEGTPEGTRVHVRGMMQAAPKQEGKGRERPLVFFLEEEDTEKGVAVEHEVYATKKAREELKRKQLKRGDIVEAVMYRHTYTIPTVNSEEITHTRHHLVTITKIEEKNAKRKNVREKTNQE